MRWFRTWGASDIDLTRAMTGDTRIAKPNYAATLAVTVAAMRKAGCVVDPELWSMTAASDCTQCHAGCHDSPTR